MRVLALILGLLLAAAGGVLAYRALFIEPSAAVVITDAGGVHELKDWWKAAGGIIMLLIGAAIAFTAARRKRA
jgi:predicted outer membrane lipoprotein